MERIVHCEEQHNDAVLNLGEYAFRYKLSESERELRKIRMKQEQILGIFDGDVLASKLHVLPQQLFLGGQSIPFGGIAGVATWPEYRRKGHVRQLMKQSLVEMRSQNIGLSMLHPFDIEFYRRFGWELTHYSRSIQMKPQDIPSFKKMNGNVARVTYDQHHQALHNIYSRHAKRYGLMLNRNEYWWRNRVLSEDSILIMSYNENGLENGFLLASLSREQLTIEEWFYDSYSAFQQLLTWIRNHDSMVRKVKMTLTPTDPLLYDLHNPRVQEDLHAYFMSRIVDIETFFTQYPFVGANDVTIQLEVQDESAEWNQGTWFLSIEDQISTISRDYKSADICISGDINTITALWLNAQRLEDLLFFECLSIKGDQDQLKNLIVEETPALLDFF